MKIEYLLAGAAECPLVRLFEFTDAEIDRLALAIGELSMGLRQCVAVGELPGSLGVDGCQVTLVCAAWDQGLAPGAATSVEVRLTAGTWDNVVALLEPFRTGSNGFQWLGAGLLVSRDGRW